MEPVGPLRVTIPVEDVPPVTEVGDTVSVASVGGVMVSVAVCFTEPTVAVTTADVVVETAEVETVNVAVFCPDGTTTFAGTIAAELLELKVTVVPLEGASPVRVTVPVEVVPPETEVGERDRFAKSGGVIVKLAEADADPDPAVITATVVLETGLVEALNVAVVAPAATVTVPGTVALAVLDESGTENPPAGAADPIVTVPVEESPPSTDVGDSDTEEIVIPLTVSTWVSPTPL